MDRKEAIKSLVAEEFDLLVIGGGITGVGIALDAQTRGLKTALIEMQDFASGTSSRSTKLIHGGLRYLKQLDFSLVMEVGRERAILYDLAPHLVHPDKMLLPLIKDGNYGKIMTNVGLMVYDWLANVEQADQRIMLSKKEALLKEPLLRKDILEGAGFYAEYRTDDARLVMSVAKTAKSNGVKLANYIKSIDFIYNSEGKVQGVQANDQLSGKQFDIKAKVVVNATGPWVDKLRKQDNSLKGKQLFLTKGVHLVIPNKKLPLSQTIYFDNLDGRMLFAVPRNEIMYLGTTDTQYTGVFENPEVTKQDVEYVLAAINNMFPSAKLKISDVQSSWAGLRPLIHEEGKNPSEMSRKDEIFHSKTNLISIAGGKLTGYRKMAERVVDEVIVKMNKIQGGFKAKKCRTKKIKLDGGAFKGEKELKKYITKLTKENPVLIKEKSLSKYLVYNYGIKTDEIIRIMKNNETDNILEAEVVYTIKNEMVQTALDFFERRTGRLNFDINSVKKNKGNVLLTMAKLLKWDEERINLEKETLSQAIKSKTKFKDNTI